MKTKKLILAKLNVKPDQIAAFLDFAPAIINNSKSESGNISYTLYRETSDGNRFVFVEEWKDQAAIDFHFAQPYFIEFGEKSKEMFVSAPDIKIYDVPAE
ncbi:MAG: putative quinol monooxygenase [Bacteroidales bacterium]|nr:putative quinol monooxygenase [Bacteroidales bacterium]